MQIKKRKNKREIIKFAVKMKKIAFFLHFTLAIRGFAIKI